MTDAKSLKDLGIPLRIDGSTRFVKGATKYTTCGDVIKMVLKKTGIQKEYRHLFSIFEVTKDGERALSCKTKITGELKKWADENNRFVLRKVEPIGERFSKEPDCKHKQKVVRVITTDKPIEGSSSDSSDTSFEEFLAKVDHTKLANFMKLFKVMTSGESTKLINKCETPRKAATHVTQKQQTGSKPHQHNPGQVQTRRKIKHPRRSRSASKLQDRHPNKIHRIDYGYVDRVPQIGKSRAADVTIRRNTHAMSKRVPVFNQDSVNDFLKAHDAAECNRRQDKQVKPKTKKGARRILPFTKFLLPAKRKTDASGTKEKPKTPVQEVLYEPNPQTVNGDIRRTGWFEILDDCREIWDSRMRQEVFSGHDDSSDISSHLCATSSPSTHSSSSDMSICADVPSDRQCYLYEVPSKKLVDYSIHSDEEYDEFGESYEEDDILNTCISDDSSDYCSNSNGGSSNDDVMGICDVTSYIKDVFGKKSGTSEDDEMDSFMKSKIYEDSSDEGVSSLESGLDNIHL